ncbi:basic proline-rich protein-like [Lepus europaeus]|uniref:basic proline-rich protein-like n=1 Tax=Lepus europaeus TaxID=9983 RepID=UPI002B46E251|nr:basic proline-rich protein-like [Lepus europaeus]
MAGPHRRVESSRRTARTPPIYLLTVSSPLELSLQSSFQLSLRVLVDYRSCAGPAERRGQPPGGDGRRTDNTVATRGPPPGHASPRRDHARADLASALANPGAGPPHDPAEAQRRTPAGEETALPPPLPALTAPHPPSPPPLLCAARMDSPDRGMDRGQGDPHRERWCGTLPLLIPQWPRPPKACALTTSRWQPAPQPADTPPLTPRRSPQTPLALYPGGLAHPHTRRSHTSTSPPHPQTPPSPALPGGGHNHLHTTRARGEAPGWTGGWVGNREEGGGTGKGPVARGTGARRGRDEEGGRVESGASGPPSVLGGTEGKNKPCKQKPPAAQPKEARGTHPGAIDRQVTLRQS